MAEPRKPKKHAGVVFVVPPKVPAWAFIPPVDILKDTGWQRVVTSPAYGFTADEAEPRRRNQFFVWCGSDTHRWVELLLLRYRKATEDKSVSGPKAFYENIVAPLGWAHGNIFEGDSAHTLGEWRDELEAIANVTLRTGTALADRLSSFATIDARGVVYEPRSLIDWCWASMARDMVLNIWYRPCGGCLEREVPSTGAPTARFPSGRTVSYCGQRCTHVAKARELRGAEILEQGAKSSDSNG